MAIERIEDLRGMLDTEIMAEIEELRSAARSILWMAALYAEGGGSNGPEMRDYLEAEAIILGKLPET